MKKIIKLSESELHKIISECVKSCLNEGIDFGKFSNNGDVALRFVKQKLGQAIQDGIIDPRALTVNEFGHVIYAKKLPSGVQINPRTFEVTRTKVGGGRRGNIEIPFDKYREQHEDDVFVPLVFVGASWNDKITPEVREKIARRYAISRAGMLLDRNRDVVIEPYLKGTGKNLDFRAYDDNGNEIYHGNTTMDALIKASFRN